MTVIFLDIDGVLNNHAALKRRPQLDSDCVAVLSTLAELIDARIVISSTWRLFHTIEELRETLGKAGLFDPDRIIDMTPRLLDFHGDICVSQPRGVEIQAWLSAHPDVARFVILDDDADMAHLAPHLVQTSMATGLTRRHLPAVLRVLEMGRSKRLSQLPLEADRHSLAAQAYRQRAALSGLLSLYEQTQQERDEARKSLADLSRGAQGRQPDRLDLRVFHRELVSAAAAADWFQVVANGGPPCFHLEGARFCLRAERWAGHGDDAGHPFVGFSVLIERIAALATTVTIRREAVACPDCNGTGTRMYAREVSDGCDRCNATGTEWS